MSDYSLESEIGAMHPSIWDVEDMMSELFTLDLDVSMVEDHRDDDEPWVRVDGEAYPATSEDVIDFVRRGVESGTIKGEVKRWCETHQAESIENHDGPSDECWRVVWADHKADEGLPLTGYGLCRIVERLVVSDGGSET